MVIYSASGVPVIAIDVDDDSYRYREIMGDNKVYLQFALTMHVEIVPGSYIQYQGETYTLMTFQDVTIRHNRDFEYKATFEGPTARFRKYRVHNLVDGRLKFDMIATPREHLQLVVGNLCEREGVGSWVIGDCIEGKEILVSYNHTRLDEALNIIADACGTEWSGTAGTVSLCRVEYNADAPLALGYGRNLGFRPGVGRLNYGEFGQIQKVYIQGSDRNIFLKDYGNATLLLPKNLTFYFDGEKFKYTVDGTTYTETGFDQSKAVAMVTDTNGFSVRLYDSPVDGNEDSLDVTEVYPKRVGKVTDVRYEYNGNYYTYAQLIAAYPNLTEDDWLEIQVDIFDDTIPSTLDFHECLPNNDEPLTVIFQSGILSGREFNATFYKQPKTKTQYDGSGTPSTVQVKPGNRFELEKASIDGFMMPGGSYRPNAGSSQDDYIVTNVSLPQAYICDYATFEGAELDALRAAAKHLYANKDAQFTFKGEVDDLYAKRNWLNIGAKLILGGCISFSHPQVQSSALVTRITAIKDYINKPYSPEITLSNETVKGGLSSRLSQMDGATEHVNRRVDDSIKYTKRSWYNAKESQSMLEKALLQEFTNTISPIAVNTMQMLVGSESLQYSFIYSLTDMTVVGHNMAFDSYGRLVCPLAYILHHTMGITSVQPNRPVTAYMRWTVAAKTIAFTDESKPYYLYIKAQRMNSAGTGSAEFVASETPIGLEDVSGYWHFLYATIGSVSEGERSIVTCNGFTEVTPGRVTAYQFLSPDGNQGVDFLNGIFRFQKGNKLFLINMSNGHDEIVFSGAMTQSKGGSQSPITCYRGAYLSTETYYYGDEVTHNGSSWWHKGTADTGPGTTAGAVEPGTDSSVWEIKSSRGSTAFKSSVFKRQNTQPEAPTGGSFSSPVPTGWSDGIPDGTAKVWMSTRIFTSDGQSPQQLAWTTPQPLTDTADIRFRYSSVETNPGNPTDNPGNWSAYESSSNIWIAIQKCSNGVWGSWEVSKIKGEKGESAIYADIDNEMDGIALNPQGQTGAAYSLQTIVSMWLGTQQQTLTGIVVSGTPTGVTATVETVNSVPTGKVTFAIPAGTSLPANTEITLAVTCELGTRNLTYTLAGLSAGSQGDAAVVYSLLPSASVVKKTKTGTYSETEVSCKKMKKVGNTDAAETNEGTLKYSIDGGQEQTYTQGILVTAFNSKLTFLFYIGNVLVDRETIPLVIDGSDGVGIQGPAGKSMRTYTYWTSAGWEGTGEYQGRDDSLTDYPNHKYQDQAIDPNDGYIYLCIHTRNGSTYATSARPGLNLASNGGCWEQMSYWKAISTEALNAVAAFIQTLTVHSLITDNERVNIHGDVIDVKNSSGKTSGLVHGGNLSSSDAISGTTISSFSGSGTSQSGGTTAVIQSLLGDIAIQRVGNTVVVPRITYSASYNGNNAAVCDLGAEIRAFLTDGTNEVSVFSKGITLDSPYQETSQEKTLSLPVGTWVLRVELEVGLISAGDTITVSASRYSGSFTVTYPSGNDASKTELAGNGFRTSWNGEGFQADANGAKILQGNSLYNAIAGASIKRIEVVTAYPSTEETGVLYIKVS